MGHLPHRLNSQPEKQDVEGFKGPVCQVCFVTIHDYDNRQGHADYHWRK